MNIVKREDMPRSLPDSSSVAPWFQASCVDLQATLCLHLLPMLCAVLCDVERPLGQCVQTTSLLSIFLPPNMRQIPGIPGLLQHQLQAQQVKVPKLALLPAWPYFF